MRIVHVVPHVTEEASGPSYSVPRLCQGLASLGHEVELSCLRASRHIEGVSVEVYPQWPLLSRFAISTRHPKALREKAELVEIVHNHSLWSMINVASGWVVPGKRAKLVTSPRGTLSPWALGRNRLLKKILWPLQKRGLERATLLHATSEVEYGEIRAMGLLAPVAIIPNGIDLPPLPAHVTKSVQVRTLLFLSRLHPTKCPDRLLHAWQALQDRHPAWNLVVAGIGDASYVQDLIKLAHNLDLKRASFPGPFYGEAKSRAYYDADLFVLPTHSENFGMVVAEALTHGCPAVVSRGAPWPGLETEHCGWWVEHDVATLIQTLDKAMALPSETLSAMGQRGREWMAREYGWESITERMEAAYRWILEGGTRPDCIRGD